MAFTRKMLKAMGIEDEKIDEIIEAHTEVTNSLKKERDTYKEDAEKLVTVENERDSYKKQIEESESDSYKEKYEKEHKDFEAYKNSVKAEQTKLKKTEAYKALLKDVGVSAKRIDSIIKVTSMDDLELDADGNIKDADKVKESVKTEWADFIVTEQTQGADTKTPPENNGGAGAKTLSRAALVARKHNELMYGVKGDNK